MHKLFNNILIPVRFTTASEKLIEKGIELANLYRCNIHLLYIASISSISSSMITRSWSFFQKVRNEDSKELERMLNKLTDRYAAKLHHGLKIVSSIEKGGRNEIAVNYILQNNIDLVLD
ncbi:MAG TPA: universal stress protein, partial [Chitinophagaceae bacterium]|nr:universal stress protein [Chitinophagaceae bacterium]